tara:strand:+ start:501 stop:1091 length:591 start_codon:yes stop_codon:yes gene_type:complete
MAQYLLIDFVTKQDFDMSVRKNIIFYSLLVVGSVGLGACAPNGQFMNPLTVSDATPAPHLDSKHSLKSSSALLAERRVAETSKYYVPSVTAVGFSSIAIQPSKSLNQRRLMAIRAAKLDAYRNLTEQLHGIYIQGETTIGEAILTSDKLGAALRGTVIGARTVKIEPTGSDTYQVELAVSQAHVDRLIRAYRNGLL